MHRLHFLGRRRADVLYWVCFSRCAVAPALISWISVNQVYCSGFYASRYNLVFSFVALLCSFWTDNNELVTELPTIRREYTRWPGVGLLSFVPNIVS